MASYIDPLSVEGSRALAQQSRAQRKARRNEKGAETKTKQKRQNKNSWEQDPYVDPMNVNAARNLAKKSRKPKDTKSVSSDTKSVSSILKKLFGKSRNKS